MLSISGWRVYLPGFMKSLSTCFFWVVGGEGGGVGLLFWLVSFFLLFCYVLFGVGVGFGFCLVFYTVSLPLPLDIARIILWHMAWLISPNSRAARHSKTCPRPKLIRQYAAVQFGRVWLWVKAGKIPGTGTPVPLKHPKSP